MRRGVPFNEHDVSRDRAAASEMVQRSGQMGVPVIVVDGQVIVGFDRSRLEQLLSMGGGRRRSLGLRVADAATMAGKVPGLVGQSGAYVGGVAPGSPAAVAGVAAGDLVVAVDGRPIQGAADLERAVSQAGARTVLTLSRNGRRLQLPVDF